MASLIARSQDVFASLRRTQTQTQTWQSIPADHLDGRGLPDAPLKADAQYFHVRINEMYLHYQRQWFSRYDPMALTVTEFSYAGQRAVVPFVVGPAMMQKSASQIPNGMVFSNTCVAGPHPYRGGSVAIAVILCQIQCQNYARKLLDIIEAAAGALDFAVALGAYMKVANVVLDGVEALMGSGGSVSALVGRRDELSPVKPGYFALISVPDSQFTGTLWVRNNQLLQGKSLEEATPFRDADYILYSILPTERDDVTTLPFHPSWQRVLQEADKSSTDSVWKSTKANMAALLGMLDTSPDLTSMHATQLGSQYIETMKTLHERAVRLSHLGPDTEQKPSELDRIREKALSVLEM